MWLLAAGFTASQLADDGAIENDLIFLFILGFAILSAVALVVNMAFNRGY